MPPKHRCFDMPIDATPFPEVRAAKYRNIPTACQSPNADNLSSQRTSRAAPKQRTVPVSVLMTRLPAPTAGDARIALPAS